LHCKTKRDKNMAKLTRVGTKGLELTREEVIDLAHNVQGIIRKAQCREVNCEILCRLDKVSSELSGIDADITDILDRNE
jgi:hypothetical protein